ncbi:flavodoxin family protein [Fusibacter sp. JL216-2]|uniref:flavodoxin family protein n=1 Tax=Fusibacter sp. JL216-2 TaxID=3071453 RepID=UPI003D3399BC
MKKILVLSGSSRKRGIGVQTLEMFEENFSKNDYEFEIVHLSDYEINYCKGCTVCFKLSEEKCPLKDDVSLIVDKMDKADGLVIVSPIYGMNISGQLKTFLDRTAYLLHRPRLFTKHAFIIVSTDLGGIKPVGGYLKYMMNAYGVNNAGSIGACSYLFNGSEMYRSELRNKLRKAAKKFELELNREKFYQPSFSQIVRFKGWQAKNKHSKESYREDYNYWKEKGWFESDYYYPIKLDGLKKIMIKLISMRINSVISRKII